MFSWLSEPMEPTTADVVVIGLGPGGEAVATKLANSGLNVVGVDRRLVGGECPYFGCVPTKMMLRAAGALAEAHRVPMLAGDVSVHPSWNPVADRIRDEATDDWDDTVAVKRFEATGGRFLRGTGRISAPDEVTVDIPAGRQVISVQKAIVLNPGTEPSIPPIEGLAETPYWTNRDAVRAREVPDSLIILGGGAIGLEFAQTFIRFGTGVTIVEAADDILPASEPEAAEIVAGVLRSEGVDLRTGVAAQQISHDGSGFAVGLSDGGRVTASNLLVAVGRATDLRELGVAAAGIDAGARTIDTDEHLRAAPGVWVVGDVAGHGAFTHMSMYHADIVVDDIIGDGELTAEYHAVPGVTFTDPEAAQVGLTEAAARAQGLEVRTGTASVPSTSRGWIHKVGNEGVIKVVADTERGVLVGATVVAPAGGEVIGALAVAVHARVPVTSLRRMIYAYPTLHRGIEDALNDLSLG
jgi:pyruvate/2-oxoglutarate dehydrogenase complex dihydrolipoamide dehydrogenase (E3) component